MLASFFVLTVCLTMANCDTDFYPNINGNLTKITWKHAVNNNKLLQEALKSDVMMLEADVVMGTITGDSNTEQVPIMAHPPKTESDLSLQNFIENVNKHNAAEKNKKGIKLDFKSIKAFENSANIIKDVKTYPIWLNADIIKGPVNATTEPVDPKRFIDLAKGQMNSVLSIGWTTYYNQTVKDESYTDDQIEDMFKVIGDKKLTQNITFPVRAGLAANNIHLMEKLLKKNPLYTLTIWSGNDDSKFIDIGKLQKLILDIGVDKVYLDVPKDVMDKLDIGEHSNGNIPKLGALTVLVTLGAYLFGKIYF